MFNPGDQVVVLLFILGSSFGVQFSGLYTVMKQASEHNYLVSTPDRRRSTQLCHINLLKPYHARSLRTEGDEAKVKPVVTIRDMPVLSPQWQLQMMW